MLKNKTEVKINIAEKTKDSSGEGRSGRRKTLIKNS